MMNTFMILALAHFISDWYFQPGEWAMKKTRFWKYRFLHSVQYMMLFIPVLFILKMSMAWAAWLFITHFLIDDYRLVKWWNRSVKRERIPFHILLVQDQILHILVLMPMVLLG